MAQPQMRERFSTKLNSLKMWLWKLWTAGSWKNTETISPCSGASMAKTQVGIRWTRIWQTSVVSEDNSAALGTLQSLPVKCFKIKCFSCEGGIISTNTFRTLSGRLSPNHLIRWWIHWFSFLTHKEKIYLHLWLWEGCRRRGCWTAESYKLWLQWKVLNLIFCFQILEDKCARFNMLKSVWSGDIFFNYLMNYLQWSWVSIG